jgi:hypothetical protein
MITPSCRVHMTANAFKDGGRVRTSHAIQVGGPLGGGGAAGSGGGGGWVGGPEAPSLQGCMASPVGVPTRSWRRPPPPSLGRRALPRRSWRTSGRTAAWR